MGNRIYRSNNDKILGGVCAGIAEYFDIDPTIIRIVWAIAFFSGFGFLAYIIAWIVIPEKPYNYSPPVRYDNQRTNFTGQMSDEQVPTESSEYQNIDSEQSQYQDMGSQDSQYKDMGSQQSPHQNMDRSEKSSKVIGIGLILVGGGYLAKEFLSFINIDDKLVFSAFFIVIGLFLITRKNK